MKTLLDFKLRGEDALDHSLTHQEYGSLEQAVASLSLFTHPDTVRQAGFSNLFRVVRYRAGQVRGSIVQTKSGKQLMLCDNTAPTDAFLWANGIERKSCSELQFNHVYPGSSCPFLYTNLANIVVTPAFLAKVTDKNKSVKDLLKYRVFDLYNGFCPEGYNKPKKPSLYDSLEWGSSTPALADFEKTLRAEMETKKKNRAVKSAAQIGWYFSGYQPDKSFQ